MLEFTLYIYIYIYIDSKYTNYMITLKYCNYIVITIVFLTSIEHYMWNFSLYLYCCWPSKKKSYKNIWEK